MSSSSVKPRNRSALRLAAGKVKGRHRISVIRQTGVTPHRIGHARGAHTMPTGLRDRAEIECFLASGEIFQQVNGGGGAGDQQDVGGAIHGLT
jgi:hypothetical protein